MDAVVTIAERKERDLKRRREDIADAMEMLRAYALRNGGRFIVFGSTATGDIRRDSDIDILVDFRVGDEHEAKMQAELICARHGVPCDVDFIAFASAGFIERVGPHALVLG